MKTLKIVLDTNVFLVSLSPTHPLFWIYKSLIEGRYELLVSNEMLTEYEEIVGSRYGLNKTDRQLDFLVLLKNVHFISPTWRWNLLSDSDDNKFVDCALVGGADFIVSNDKGFRALSQIEFPSIKVLTSDEFEALFKIELS